MNPIRAEIIRKIMHKPGSHFNELWDKKLASNKFAYHLKVLEEDGLIEHKDECYCLTHEGKKYSTFVDGESGKESRLPLPCVIVVVIKDNKVLMKERSREPFYGYWGFSGGKIKFSQYILEAAKEELKEETGLEADLVIKGLFCSKTYNNGQLSYNHQIFIVRGDRPRGKLSKKTREGNNKWIDLEKLEDVQIFPDVPYLVKAALGEGFTLVEMDRHQENDIFKKIDNIRITRL